MIKTIYSINTPPFRGAETAAAVSLRNIISYKRSKTNCFTKKDCRKIAAALLLTYSVFLFDGLNSDVLRSAERKDTDENNMDEYQTQAEFVVMVKSGRKMQLI